MILDHTVQLGKEKCLVVLGVPFRHFSEAGFTLKHKDVRVLGMDLVCESTGELVCEFLEELVLKYGLPSQIVSDHGSDLKKGIRLFIEQHPGVIHTYDITHRTASFLKAELDRDTNWIDFTKKASLSSAQLQQTSLHTLMPPSQRKKARYMSFSALVQWAYGLLNFYNEARFDLISPDYFLSDSVARMWLKMNRAVTYNQLQPVIARHFHTRSVFEDSLIACLPPLVGTQQLQELVLLSSCGRSLFEEKLGWLLQFKTQIQEYYQLFMCANWSQRKVKDEGLHAASHLELQRDLEKKGNLTDKVKRFAEKMQNFVAEEGSKVKEGATWLGTSDIIESLFGKYKWFSERGPQKTLGNLLLALPLLTSTASKDLVKKALESVAVKDWHTWSKKKFGTPTKIHFKTGSATREVLA